MGKRKNTNTDSFDAIYRRLEEVMLANSGENEFEEIFKIILIKLWQEMNVSDKVHTLNEADALLAKMDSQWPGVLLETKFNVTQEQFDVCLDIVKDYFFSENGYESIDGIFEYLISREKKGAKGQFFTPRYIVDFCVKILNPKCGESILDPAAGSGAFLYHAYLHGGVSGSDLWGFDFDNITTRIARLLLYIADIDSFHVYKVNSLIKNEIRASFLDKRQFDLSTTIEDILRIEKKKELFDIIITNPPFAGEIVEPDILESYVTSFGKMRVERDVLFIERCIKFLKPGGRMGIILPDNIFGSKDNEKLRRWIYETCQIVGVIGIPRNTFMPHTAVKTSILFLKKRKKRREREEPIFFGISEQPGKDSRGNPLFKNGRGKSWRDVDHDLDTVFTEFKNFLINEGIGWW